MRKVVPLGLAIAGAALGEIYIVDPSIDQYKQKTDQVFYDTYQNTQSVIAKGIRRNNPSEAPVFSSVSTDQRLVSGSRLPKLPLLTNYNSVFGTEVLGGKQRRVCWVTAPGMMGPVYYGYEIDDKGDVVASTASVAVGGSYQYRYGWVPKRRSGFWTWGAPVSSSIGIGQDASGVTCVATCGGGCVRQRKTVRKLMLDTSCRTGSLYVAVMERRRSCWSCGKSTCYGSWSGWYEISRGRIEDQVTLTQSSSKGAVLWGGAQAFTLNQ